MKIERIIKVKAPNGSKIKVIGPLWKVFENLVAENQVYSLYMSFVYFLSCYPIDINADLIEGLFNKVIEDNFLEELNTHTNEDGNIDWEDVLQDIKIIKDLKEEIREKREDFKWSPFIENYRKERDQNLDYFS